MTTRAQHYSNKARHSQREFNQEKPKLQPVGSDTTWIGEFTASLAGLRTPLTVNSILALPLGHTSTERELNLRKASSMGVLRMRVVQTEHRIGPKTSVMAFSHFEWVLA